MTQISRVYPLGHTLPLPGTCLSASQVVMAPTGGRLYYIVHYYILLAQKSVVIALLWKGY